MRMTQPTKDVFHGGCLGSCKHSKETSGIQPENWRRCAWSWFRCGLSGISWFDVSNFWLCYKEHTVIKIFSKKQMQSKVDVRLSCYYIIRGKGILVEPSIDLSLAIRFVDLLMLTLNRPPLWNSRRPQDSKLKTDRVEDRKYPSRRNSPCGVHLTHHQETNKTDGGNARREHDAASLSGLSENGSLDLDSSNVWPLWWLEIRLNANPYNFYTFLDIIHTWYAYTTKYFNVIHIFHSIFIFSQEVLEMI